MQTDQKLRRLNPFEGLCLTSQDLLDEQGYHRASLHRHTLYLHGSGIVQGLQVELAAKSGKYRAVVQQGYGITSLGQGVLLPEAVAVPLEVPKSEGEYMLWLFHVEAADEDANRPVFDTTDTSSARVLEFCAPRLHPADEAQQDAVALCRINVRQGRMVQVMLPVPRAGRQARAAESYLKPRLSEFIHLSKNVMTRLYRTALVQDLDLAGLNFSSSLVSAEFLLIEEGTPDRVLYRSAGALIGYASSYYDVLPSTTDRIKKFTDFVRKANASVPGVDQSDEIWLKWFDKFERLLVPLKKVSDELDKKADARR